MIHKHYRWIALVLLAAVLISACTAVLSLPKPQTFALQSMSHIAMGLPEQDVYIEQEPGSDQVVRVAPGEETAAADLPVYAASELVEHNLFATGDAPFGPFPKGEALGMTLGEWLAASGEGVYTVTGDRARLDMTYEKLVPNGVYTVWCTRTTFPPNINVVDKACGAADGSQNTFVADAYGNGHFTLDLDTLPVSTAETVSVIAIAYHSDGKTYGAYTGDFGRNSHVHVAAIIPVPE